MNKFSQIILVAAVGLLDFTDNTLAANAVEVFHFNSQTSAWENQHILHMEKID